MRLRPSHVVVLALGMALASAPGAARAQNIPAPGSGIVYETTFYSPPENFYTGIGYPSAAVNAVRGQNLDVSGSLVYAQIAPNEYPGVPYEARVVLKNSLGVYQ